MSNQEASKAGYLLGKGPNKKGYDRISAFMGCNLIIIGRENTSILKLGFFFLYYKYYLSYFAFDFEVICEVALWLFTIIMHTPFLVTYYYAYFTNGPFLIKKLINS